MQDPKFEKQVQQKMEELSFSPSDAVWLKVDAEINRKRKRRGAFIWLILLAVIFTAASLFVASITGKSRLADTNRSLTTLPTEKNATNSIPDEKPTEPGQDARINPAQLNQLSVGSPGLKTKSATAVTKNHFISSDKHRILTQSRGVTSPRKYENASSNLPPTTAVENNSSSSSSTLTEDRKTMEEKKEPTIVKSMPSDSSGQAKLPTPGKVSGAMKSEKKKEPAKWNLGFTTGTGISSVRQSLFTTTHVGNDDPRLVPSSGGVGTPQGAFYQSSEIQSSYSFQGGFYLKRSLAKKLSFSAGLDYHYYTTKVTTGAGADSTIYVSYNNAAVIPVSGAYRSGAAATHTNHYHFLELPLALGLPFYTSKKITLTWEAGSSLSYLLYSDALQFDNHTGLYYRNKAAFNRFQVNAATAVLAGFPGGKFDWQIGPQIEYGLTGLLNKNMEHSEHLLYLGLKFSLLLGKK